MTVIRGTLIDLERKGPDFVSLARLRVVHDEGEQEVALPLFAKAGRDYVGRFVEVGNSLGQVPGMFGQTIISMNGEGSAAISMPEERYRALLREYF
ncbi:MAG: hypothetical protein H6502_03485 [Candidatus Woesearchaeota archaeon]|nr:MAG: hypothetical protein H6502_03485 [Candidatus Woesearchaeota archaeon]